MIVNKLRSLSVTILFVFIILIIGACSPKEDTNKSKSDDKENTVIEDPPQNHSDTNADQSIIEKYQKLYLVNDYYPDCFVNQKCLLLSDDSIVIFWAITNAEVSVVIPYQSVSRIDTVTVSDCVFITISDKNGKENQINLSSENAMQVLKILEQRTNAE